MFGIGIQELVVIFFIALLIFGASRLPEIGKSLGKAIREFKKAGSEIKDTIEESAKDDEKEKKKK
jgi:sec-independent protein translocase protein TatA